MPVPITEHAILIFVLLTQVWTLPTEAVPLGVDTVLEQELGSSLGHKPLKRHRASLLRKRWDWSKASVESRTEWAIVLRRYALVDTELANLVMHMDQVFPADQRNFTAENGIDPWEAAKLRGKVEKLSDNLKAALNDQQVSNSTFTDMERDPKINRTQQQALHAEHEREASRANELADLGHTALVDAEALQVMFNPARLRGSGTKKGSTRVAESPTVAKLLERFREDVQGFRSRRAASEKEEPISHA